MGALLPGPCSSHTVRSHTGQPGKQPPDKESTMKTTRDGGSARVTLNDIARLAGVSVTTVSRVLGGRSGEVKISPETTRKITEIAREQEYRPNLFAKALRTNKSHLVGLVVWDFANPFFGAIVVGAQTTLARSGYTAVLSDARESESELFASLSRMGDFQTDGALVIGGPADFSLLMPAVTRDNPRRTIFVATRNPDPNGASVVADNYEGGRMGVDHLITRWRRPLVCLRPQESNYDVEERARGIEAGVATHLYDQNFTTRITKLGEEGGYKACSELLREAKPPLSLFAFTDLTAVGALHAARDAGLRVPDDIAIMGFDDLSFAAHLNPPLSTVRQPRGTLGSRGAELLIEQLDGPADEPESGLTFETVPTELIVRESA